MSFGVIRCHTVQLLLTHSDVYSSHGIQEAGRGLIRPGPGPALVQGTAGPCSATCHPSAAGEQGRVGDQGRGLKQWAALGVARPVVIPGWVQVFPQGHWQGHTGWDS